jgi:hypothetical protein
MGVVWERMTEGFDGNVGKGKRQMFSGGDRGGSRDGRARVNEGDEASRTGGAHRFGQFGKRANMNPRHEGIRRSGLKAAHRIADFATAENPRNQLFSANSRDCETRQTAA